MAARGVVVLLAIVAAATAVPAGLDPIISKLDPEGLRYGYLRDDEGIPHLVDSWIKASDIRKMARYNPDKDNKYHLYTSVGRFITWLNQASGASVDNYHILGYSVGAHQAGIVGRSLLGQASYITGLDPADRWIASQALKSTDAIYTEVIHTNIRNIGVEKPCGDVDFYPNGGVNMPGCVTAVCDHYRSYFFMGESLVTGGFTGTQCSSLEDAKAGTCDQVGRLNMGGIKPKTGSSGIYFVRTNPSAPFSQG